MFMYGNNSRFWFAFVYFVYPIKLSTLVLGDRPARTRQETNPWFLERYTWNKLWFLERQYKTNHWYGEGRCETSTWFSEKTIRKKDITNYSGAWYLEWSVKDKRKYREENRTELTSINRLIVNGSTELRVGQTKCTHIGVGCELILRQTPRRYEAGLVNKLVPYAYL